jgi:hypothetical protein
MSALFPRLRTFSVVDIGKMLAILGGGAGLFLFTAKQTTGISAKPRDWALYFICLGFSFLVGWGELLSKTAKGKRLTEKKSKIADDDAV